MPTARSISSLTTSAATSRAGLCATWSIARCSTERSFGAVRQLLPGRGDLRLHLGWRRERAVGFAIPMLRVLKIAFEDVDDAMQPGGIDGFLLLDDGVGLL